MEFVLCFALFWVPFFLGMVEIGLNLIRAIEVTEVCRDAAHMFSYGIDFSDPGNQAILLKTAQGLDISATGQGVVILSDISYIGDNDCTGANLQANPSSCPNWNKYVIRKRIVIGNSSIRQSAFGTPKAGDTDSSGNIAPMTYLTDTSCQASVTPGTPGFSNLMTLAPGQYAYMAEMTLNSPDLSSWGPLGNTGSSALSIF